MSKLTPSTTPDGLGADGFPLGKNIRQVSDEFQCACVVCFSPNAWMKLTKKKTYHIKCDKCRSITFLNSSVSQGLWRAWQSLLKKDPETREHLQSQLAGHFPQD